MKSVCGHHPKIPGGEHLTADGYPEELVIDEKEFLDQSYDYDFRHLTDSSACKRGGEPYMRPAGWYRVALKVRGKFEDDVWLGAPGWRRESSQDEWPVCFHGTSFKGAEGIIENGFKPGPRELFGRGVYSTPDINIANSYATEFESKKDGKRYKVLLQNRINDKKREKCKRKDYWLIPIPKGTPADKEQDIIHHSIRAYGVLFKEIKK
ncbi:uncharacterized protein LOC134448726 [Engraulis encrasicolus]|uniref:uncharacterized protein LOC134448726 n=1 Tax=Engraulis encrasicolus TaxID=184585 RepID=UPI002FD2E5DF